MGFQYPEVFYLLFVVPLFWWNRGQRIHVHPALSLLPKDPVSVGVDLLIKLAWTLCALSLIFSASLPYLKEHWVEKTGSGAHVVLLFDRSSSMNENFTGRRMGAKAQESKSATARKLLHEFVSRREHDLFALVTFAGAPIYVTPLTEDREAILAGIDASGGRGHGITNMGPGLAMALDYFQGRPRTGSRIILMVSDGGARIDEETRDRLTQGFQQTESSLYWIYLRNPTGARLNERPDNPNESSTPEYFLNEYFKTLGVPYQAFEAENPDAMERAIQAVERLENQPITYREMLPRRDLTPGALITALIMIMILMYLKHLEVEQWID